MRSLRALGRVFYMAGDEFSLVRLVPAERASPKKRSRLSYFLSLSRFRTHTHIVPRVHTIIHTMALPSRNSPPTNRCCHSSDSTNGDETHQHCARPVRWPMLASQYTARKREQSRIGSRSKHRVGGREEGSTALQGKKTVSRKVMFCLDIS